MNRAAWLMYAVEDSHMNPGDVVVIYGCGPIALMAMQIFLSLWRENGDHN
jgi:threonine dehydrogenase-like Zn-dependent dehydrogenase